MLTVLSSEEEGEELDMKALEKELADDNWLLLSFGGKELGYTLSPYGQR